MELARVTYPMRRVEDRADEVGIDRLDFEDGIDLLVEAGYPAEVTAADAWEPFQAQRSTYAATACQPLYWTMAVPAPWSGGRACSSTR